MKRTLILITCLATVACLTWAQHGRGGGAGGGQGAPPQISHPSNSHAPAGNAAHGPAAAPRVKAPDFGARLAANPALTARLQPLLPAGMAMTDAAQGFKNQGQFVAALHVANNLNIPFADLRTAMTGPDRLSLGKAIQQFRPGIDKKTVAADVKTAEAEAKEDLATK